MALTDLLVAWYKLDEASGNALDAHGSNDLSDVGSVSSATGKIGTSRVFSGDSFHAPDAGIHAFGDEAFTFAFWMRSTNQGVVRRSVLGKWSESGDNRSYVIITDNGASGRLHLQVSSNGAAVTTFAAYPTGTISNDTWDFVVAWHDPVANTLNMQLNGGTPISQSYSSGIFSGSTSTFKLAASATGGHAFQGRLDEVGVWNRVLTADERSFLYNSGAGRSYDDLGLFEPAITTSSLPNGVVGIPYSQTLEVVGGNGGVTFTEQVGSLAGSGLSLSSDGVISGVPTIVEDVTVTYRATDSIGLYDEATLTISIAPAADYIGIGTFEIIPARQSFTQVRAVTRSNTGASLNFSTHVTAQIEIIGSTVTPLPPVNLRSYYDGVTLTWEWDASPSAGVTSYKITDEFDRILAVVQQPIYLEAPKKEQVTRRIYAVTSNGLASTAYLTATFLKPFRFRWDTFIETTLNSDFTLTVSGTGTTYRGAVLGTVALLQPIPARIYFSPHRNDANQGLAFTSTKAWFPTPFFTSVFFNDDGTFGTFPANSSFGTYEAGDLFVLVVDNGDVDLYRRTLSSNGRVEETLVHSYGTLAGVPYFFVKAYTDDGIGAIIDLLPTIVGNLVDGIGQIPATSQNVSNATYTASTGVATRTSGAGWGTSGLSLVEGIRADQAGAFYFNATGGTSTVDGSGVAVGLSNTDPNTNVTPMPFHIICESDGSLSVYNNGALLTNITDPAANGTTPLTGLEVLSLGRSLSGAPYVSVDDVIVYEYTAASTALKEDALILDIAFNGSLGASWAVTGIELIRPYTDVLTPDGNVVAMTVGLEEDALLGSNKVYEIPKFAVDTTATGEALIIQPDGTVANASIVTGINIGDAITGGGANRILYQDGSSNLASSADFTYDGRLTIRRTTEQQRWEYDGSNYANLTVGATGITTFASTGSASQFIFSNAVRVDNVFEIRDTANSRQVRLRVSASVVEFQAKADWETYSSPAVPALKFPAGQTNLTYLELGFHSILRSNGGNVSIVPDGVNAIVTTSTVTLIQQTPLVVGHSAHSGIARSEVRYTSGAQFAVLYDGSNYQSTTVSSTGIVTFNAVGSGAKFVFSDAVEVPNAGWATSWLNSVEAPTKDALFRNTQYENINESYVLDDTLGNTGASFTLEASTYYAIELHIAYEKTDSIGLANLKLDFNGGTATWLDFNLEVQDIDNSDGSLAGYGILTSASNVFTTTTDAGYLRIRGRVRTNAAGTFILRGAQSVTSTDPTTANGWMKVTKLQ